MSLTKFQNIFFPSKQKLCFSMYRVIQEEVYTSFFAIFPLSRGLEKWLCTFFNSPACAETKKEKIFYPKIEIRIGIYKNVMRIPCLKWWKLTFQPISCDTLFFYCLSFQVTFRMWFCILFNSPASAESKNV